MKKFLIAFIALILGVVIGMGIWHGIAYEDNLKASAGSAWETIKSAFVKKDDTKQPENPTPDKPDNPPQEEINLDGFYYIDVTDVDGGIIFVQVKENAYRPIGGRMTDSNIYFFDGWETNTEFETLNTTEDEKYIHVYCEADKMAIYDKATSTLYYDFSGGEQFPGETYEDQLLYEMVPFTEYDVVECSHEVEMEITSSSASCTESGTMEIFCYDCNALLRTETIPALGHDYVDWVCSRCGVEHEHTFSKWGLLISPTCTEIGHEQRDCSICGKSEMRDIPATGHTFDAGICTSCNALDEEFYNNFVGYWFTETTGFKEESFGKYYIQVYKDGDNYIFTRSGYKVENGEIVLYQNSTDYSDPETWTFTSTNRIIEFTLTRQDTAINGTYEGQTLVVGDMTFTKTDKPIRYDGSTSYVTPL